jgi:hypothetical protein
MFDGGFKIISEYQSHEGRESDQRQIAGENMRSIHARCSNPKATAVLYRTERRMASLAPMLYLGTRISRNAVAARAGRARPDACREWLCILGAPVG